MTNRSATPVLFGFDFQANAAIVLMLENIKYMTSIRLEGYEDIEINLNDGSSVLAQAKAVVNSSTDFSNVISNLKKTIVSLSEAEHKSHSVKELIYITNSPNPFNEKQLNPIFYGVAQRSYDSLPQALKNKISKIIENASNKIFNKQNKETFSRKQLIEELETFANIITAKNNDPKYKNVLNKIIEKANTLPTSYNSIHAFIVKYAKNKYNHKSITERLLSGSEATIEHAIPEFLGGKTTPSNLINECARDNHSRRHDNIIQQIRKHPSPTFTRR